MSSSRTSAAGAPARALALTGNADAAQAVADDIAQIPSETDWKVIAETAAARRTIDDFIADYGQLSGVIDYRANLPDLNGVESGSGRLGTFADGGAVTGPGGLRADRIPVLMSAGEHVLDAEDVSRRMGGQAGVQAFRSSLYQGLARYADGGAIGAARFGDMHGDINSRTLAPMPAHYSSTSYGGTTVAPTVSLRSGDNF